MSSLPPLQALYSPRQYISSDDLRYMRHENDDFDSSSSNDVVSSSQWDDAQYTDDENDLKDQVPSSPSSSSSSSSLLSRKAVILLLLSIIIAVCITGYSNSYGFPRNIITWHTGGITSGDGGSSSGGVYLSSDANADPDIPILSTEEFRLTATNEYGVYDAPYPWLNDGTGAKLVEPMKRTILTASGPFVDDRPEEAGELSFNWLIERYEGDVSTHKSFIDITITRPGNYDIRVQVISTLHHNTTHYTALRTLQYNTIHTTLRTPQYTTLHYVRNNTIPTQSQSSILLIPYSLLNILSK